jgi:single-strand DNA-binding protein
MAAYNRVILVGNITREIDLTKTQSGTAVTDIGLAVNERRKNQSGEWVEDPQFIDITLWGRTAEVAAEYLGKGSPILIEGRLKLETWESDGQKRSKLKVVAEKMQMLGKAKTSSKASDENAGPAAATDDTSVIVMAGAPEEDVPF